MGDDARRAVLVCSCLEEVEYERREQGVGNMVGLHLDVKAILSAHVELRLPTAGYDRAGGVEG